MKVIAHHHLSTGHGRCQVIAPEVFVLDDTGYNRMAPFEVPAALEVQARAGADACPERCIELIE